MAKRRKFTPEFKAEVVLEVLSGATSWLDNPLLFQRFDFACEHFNLSFK